MLKDLRLIRINPLIPLMAMMVVLLGLGWLSADWRAGNVDSKIRNSLLLQAVKIAGAINPELVKSLSFTPEDKGTPAFKKIREQMVAYGNIISQRGIYSMTLRDGLLFFGPENYSESDPMASTPGTIYEKPPSESYEIFSGRKPVVIGPVTDEYGTFISALAPVYDPRTSEVLMAIGIDFMSDEWRVAVNKARMGPLAITFFLVLVLVTGAALIFWRSRVSVKQGVLFRYIESIMAGIFGLILTAAGTFLVFEAENLEKSKIFIRSSNAIAEAASAIFHDIRNNIAAIVRFQQGSIHVDWQEFIVFSEPMTRTPGIDGYQLAFSIPEMNKEKFEAQIVNDGVKNFFIWEINEKGERTPVSKRSVYYPVSYAAPWKENEKEVGFDLGSETYLKSALKESARTGLVVAENSVYLNQDGVEEPCMLIFQPIFLERAKEAITRSDAKADGNLYGFAIGVIRLKSILDMVLKKHSDEGLFVDMYLMDLTNKIVPAILASCPSERTGRHPVIMEREYFKHYTHVAVHPIFVFGRPLALVSHPSSAFNDLHPLRESLLVGFAGIFLTCVLIIVTVFWTNRHADLELQVRERTSALRESEKQLRVLFDNAINGVALHEIVLDENGKPVDYVFLQANPGFEKHTGLKVEDVIDKRATDLFSGIEILSFIDIYGKVALGGEAVTFEQFFKPLQRYFIINAYQVGNGRFATIFLDITEQKKSEGEKNKLQAQLAQAQKMEAVGRLAGGVAHDFNNMLSVILGYTELASEKLRNSDPARQDLAEVTFAAKRSTELVRQLMAFARRQVISPVILDLNDCVSGMLKMLRRLIGEDVNLAWIPGHGLWNVKIDPSQIDQVLANLMVNSRDAIEGTGRVTIETHNVIFDYDYCKDHAGSVPGEYVLLAVSDDGCGMEKETQANIFEPFFTTKASGKGTGLGLSTVFGIVKQNKGYINVYTEPGEGATFRIYLPRFGGESIPVRANEMVDKPPGGSETVLLVEDEEAVLKLAKVMLERLGYNVLSAGTPAEAIRLATEYKEDIDLLITDVVMPEMNGVKLAEKLNSVRAGMKCLYMSGYTANAAIHRGILNNGMHLVQKPFSFDILAGKVREALK